MWRRSCLDDTMELKVRELGGEGDVDWKCTRCSWNVWLAFTGVFYLQWPLTLRGLHSVDCLGSAIASARC